MTKPAIAAAAAKLIETGGMGKFSLRELAKELGVGPTTIHAHFKGGVNEISKPSAEQKDASARMHETIASLSPTEFPNLMELREAIVAETFEAGKPFPDVAAAYVDRRVATPGLK